MGPRGIESRFKQNRPSISDLPGHQFYPGAHRHACTFCFVRKPSPGDGMSLLLHRGPESETFSCEAKASSFEIMLDGREMHPETGSEAPSEPSIGKLLTDGQCQEGHSAAWPWLVAAPSLISTCLGLAESPWWSMSSSEPSLNYWGLFYLGLAAEKTWRPFLLITLLQCICSLHCPFLAAGEGVNCSWLRAPLSARSLLFIHPPRAAAMWGLLIPAAGIKCRRLWGSWV